MKIKNLRLWWRSLTSEWELWNKTDRLSLMIWLLKQRDDKKRQEILIFWQEANKQKSHKSFSMWCTTINSVHLSQNQGRPESSSQIKSMLRSSKDKSVKNKRYFCWFLFGYSFSNKSSHQSQNTSAIRSLKNAKKRKNRSLKIVKNKVNKSVDEQPNWVSNISHMSNSPLFEKYIKHRRICREKFMPSFERSSSEAEKDSRQQNSCHIVIKNPIEYDPECGRNMNVKADRPRVPTSTVQLNLNESGTSLLWDSIISNLEPLFFNFTIVTKTT